MEKTLAELMAITDFAIYPPDQALKLLGMLIDASGDAHRVDGLHQAITACQEWLSRETDSARRALLHNFESNAWSALSVERASGSASEWDWQSEKLEREIISLRRAVGEQGFASLDVVPRCLVFTNLGNLMDQLGRFVEAISYWDQAIALDPNFGMAVGNRGIGLVQYSDLLYDRGHSCIYRQLGACAIYKTRSICRHVQTPFVSSSRRSSVRSASPRPALIAAGSDTTLRFGGCIG